MNDAQTLEQVLDLQFPLGAAVKVELEIHRTTCAGDVAG